MDLLELKKTFQKGVGKSPGLARDLLGLDESAEDNHVAYELLRGITAENLKQLSISPEKKQDPRPPVDESKVMHSAEGKSLLDRLTNSINQGTSALEDISDIRTLVAILHAGSLRLRRAAAQRIETIIRHDVPNEALKLLADAIQNNRDLDIAYELGLVSRMLPGAVGRKARAEQARWKRIAEETEKDVEGFWQGSVHTNPLAMMPVDQRAQLGLRTKDLSNATLCYLSSVLEGSDGIADAEDQLALLVSLRYCGDSRIVPSLCVLLESNDFHTSSEAARCLARIDDPRVHPALASAFERSVSVRERLILAAALGLQGDVRGREFLKGHLTDRDKTQLLLVLEGLETLGSSEDVETVALLLEEDDLPLNLAATRTLGRIGDLRALIPLRDMLQTPRASSIRAEVEDALYDVRERLFLRGEEIPESETVVFALQAVSKAQLSAKRDPASVRIRSYWDYIRGWFWMLLGFSRRAIARFEGAASRRPGWVHPLLSIAMIHSRKERYAQALSAFRRSIEADKFHVERNPLVARTLALCFLRRAEQIEQEGRSDVARSIIDEVLALDLRFAPPSILFELRRRRDSFQLGDAS
ncbi:MAG: HEAT repeat domain-containing protein [Myxococcales bacterium]|nr:MAG: HEAT repeat domain-containing protein [Myxococcales bacterium]